MWGLISDFLFDNWKSVVIGLVITSGLGYVTHLRISNANLKDDLQDRELQIDSLEAVNDTTREIKNILADSLRYFERRAVQTELEADSLDKALERESRVRANAEARVDSLESVIASSSVSEDSLGVRTASFDFYDEPYTIDAEIVMPPPPRSANLILNVKLDPIPLSFRVGCSENPDTDIKRATIGITTPDWAEVELKEVTQEPGVCNPQVEVPEEGFLKKNRGKIGLGAGTILTTIMSLIF